MNAKITIEVARQRFEQGLPVLIGGCGMTTHKRYEVMLKKDMEPNFDYQIQVFKNQTNAHDVFFFALKRDKDGEYQYYNTKFSMMPVVEETGEEMVEIIVKRREIWTQDVKVYLPKSSATIDEAIDIVEDDGGTEVYNTQRYSDTCGSQYWTVAGPTPELTRENPLHSLDVD